MIGFILKMAFVSYVISVVLLPILMVIVTLAVIFS